MHDLFSTPVRRVLRPIVQRVRDERLICRGVIAINPGRDHVIAFFHMMDIPPFGDYDTGRLVSEKLGQTMSRPRRALHRVQLRMTYAAGK